MAAFWAVNATACVPVTRMGPDRDVTGWRSYLGTPRHDASANESLATAAPSRVWRTGVGRSVRGGVAIGDSVIAAGTSDRSVALLDRQQGRLLWRRRVGGTVASAPLLDQDRLYVATQATPNGRVMALRLKTGATIWSTSTDGISAPLALTNSLVFAVTDAGVVQAFDVATGMSAWRRPLGRAARAAPVPVGDAVAVATIGDSLYLLDQASGTIKSRIATPGTVLGTPATDGVHLYCATATGRLLSVALAGFTVVWDRPVGDPVYGAPALVHDTLYVVTGGGTLWQVPVDAPDQARSIDLKLPATAGPTPVAGGILIGGTSGEVLFVEAATDSVGWRMRVRGPIEEPPLVRDRELILVSGGGAVEVYR